jgi:hypothetical protein
MTKVTSKKPEKKVIKPLTKEQKKLQMKENKKVAEEEKQQEEDEMIEEKWDQEDWGFLVNYYTKRKNKLKLDSDQYSYVLHELAVVYKEQGNYLKSYEYALATLKSAKGCPNALVTQAQLIVNHDQGEASREENLRHACEITLQAIHSRTKEGTLFPFSLYLFSFFPSQCLSFLFSLYLSLSLHFLTLWS